MNDANTSKDGLLLSIIIPHFNSVKSLKKLLDSIPDAKSIETIVVDDNSDDLESYNRLKEEAFSNTIFLRNENGPKGAGTCRNAGLSSATGKWLLFADADDYFLDNFYDIVSKYFNSPKDVVFFTPISKDLLTGESSDRHIAYQELIENAENTDDFKAQLLLKYGFHVPWSKLIKREFVIQNGIRFDEVIASNDIMFSTKIGYLMKDYMVSREKIYCVTKGIGTLTKTVNENVFFSRLNVLIRRNLYLKERLSREDFSLVEFNGGGMIANCVLYKLGVRNTMKTIWLLSKNKVKFLNGILLRPGRLFGEIKRHFYRVKQEKKYHI